MNLQILEENVQSFITDNLTTNITKLVLKGSPFNDITIQELANQIIAKHKSLKKLPTWFATKNIYYPQKISIEQTSSEVTAAYKASLVSGNTLIDITGGYGVDCFAFSKKINEVIHCEINNDLSKIVQYNFEQLKIKNIVTIGGNGIEYLKNSTKKIDWIYIDPSRRSDIKGKVFLLNDCLPNVPENLDFLFSKSNNILIKNSPILDITSTINELSFVKEIHILATNNEVKELLFLLEKGYTNHIQIKTSNIQKSKVQVFKFNYQKEVYSEYSEPLTYLYEPNSAILKSGGFHHVSDQLNLYKLHQHSHLYTSNERICNFPGRTFTINKVIAYDKKQVRKNLEKNKANITIRNFPKTVAQIRKETKIVDGGENYLFFTTTCNDKKKVIFCSQIFD
ncbi:RsmD family RNA methyltransferase [Tenacibaculum sp.]|nr:RsmD family RNA methyltransferase [Tenacibaculum sp.]